MYYILFCFLALQLIFTITKGAPDKTWKDNDRIIGGEDAAPGEFPYHVAIGYDFDYICGGAIISERTVLTAGHCLVGAMPQYLIVIAGTNKLNRGGVLYNSERIIIHPGINLDIVNNDIGLIILNTRIEFNNLIKSHPIATGITGEGETVTLTGWNVLNYPKAVVDLRKIILTTISSERCRKHFPVIVNQICTLAEPGKGPCFSNSGSPLVDNKTIIGIVSYRRPCAVGFPNVYTRVSDYATWINQNKL